MKNYLMALDAGTGAGRCFLISTDGESVIEAYHEWDYEYPPIAQPGGVEFNPNNFWDIFVELIKEAMQKGGILPEQIIGISSTSQREGIVLIDENGRELYAGPNFDQRRPSNHLEISIENGELIHTISGHWPMPMFSPYRLLWFKEHRPDIFNRISKMLLINDWILYRLSGEYGTEPSNGNETLLFDFRNRNWSKNLIKKLDFPEYIFPNVLESGTCLGFVTPKSALETGLLPGTPVSMGGGDTQCALLGMGALNSGDVGVVLGTYGPIQMVLDKPVLADPKLVWSGCHVVPNKWVIESTTMEAGLAFRWLRDLFYDKNSVDIYSLMESEAANSQPGANGILAYIGPRLPDYQDLQFSCSGGFRTQIQHTTDSICRGDFARATLENVAFSILANVSRLSRISDHKINNLRICGGLSKSTTLIKTVANLLGIGVSVPNQKEGSALGASICAGIGSGIFKSFTEGVEALSKFHQHIEPEPDQMGNYKRLYGKWIESYSEMYGSTLD